MSKKIFVAGLVVGVSALTVATTVLATRFNPRIARGDPVQYHISLNDKSAVETKDDGYLHQITIKENMFDMIGWSETGGTFGSIKKATYGSYEYNGMVYNRSLINGFTSFSVTFSGGSLSYVLSDFLMENMNFNGAPLNSGESVNVPDNKCYFIIYNESETPVSINSVDLTYTCDASIDAEMIFNKNSAMGGARSLAKRTTLYDNLVELENKPTVYTNNYSDYTGNHISPDHKDPWYRWNGRYFAGETYLGTDFTFGMTIIGNVSSMINPAKNFHYNVWPQISYSGCTEDQWVQTYIGNDNYEPLGSANRLHPDDPLSDNSFAGRFFTDYGWYDSQWKFCDPDTTLIEGGTYTFREAYEIYNLPFWFLKFHVHLDADNDAVCDIYINGFYLVQQRIFENYDKVNKPSMYIKTLPMHLVNYGIDAAGTPGESYVGSFTYPRIISAT